MFSSCSLGAQSVGSATSTFPRMRGILGDLNGSASCSGPSRGAAPESQDFYGQPVPRQTLQICLLCTSAILGASGAHADSCPTAKDKIATDRPDVTNSSLVVPVGSLQSENGVNFSARDGGRFVDGTATRWRLGIAPCLELLVDLPSYVANIQAPGNSGFSNVAPAIKWQVSPIPGKFDLSLVVGAALPTGAVDIAGRGPQPYIQMPWSWELRDGWGVSGMLTEFFRPSEPKIKRISEATFVVERKMTDKASLFVEYVGDYPENASPSQLLNSGLAYRLTPTQQVDIHIAFGLNHNAPSYIVGLGYSFRFDGPLAGNSR